MTLYHFSHSHASVENYPKWKGPTTISDIPFFTEPWLWEEGYLLNQKPQNLKPPNQPSVDSQLYCCDVIGEPLTPINDGIYLGNWSYNPTGCFQK